MKRYKSIINNTLLFLLTNIVGFNVGPICYGLIVIKLRAIEISEDNFNNVTLNHFITTVSWTWLACAIVSTSIFFFRGRWKIFFGSMPILIPLVYSLLYLKNFL